MTITARVENAEPIVKSIFFVARHRSIIPVHRDIANLPENYKRLTEVTSCVITKHMTSWLACSELTRTSIQLASNGRWEEALSVDQTFGVALSEWLKVSGADIAVESVYHDGKGNFKGFFGFRRQLEDVGKRISFWQDVVSQSRKFDTKPPGDQLAAWLSLLGQPRLTDTDPAGVKLGVFNQWLTAGPVDLRGERLTENDLREGPDWLRSGASAPICKERYWLAPERIWVAELASVQKDGVYFPQQCLLPG